MTVESQNLEQILHKTWGYSSFRPFQKEAIDSIMQRRDSLVVLPTGGGKSICFQVPAMALDGTAVVVSPLIALMKDQVDGLRANGVAAACINSSMSYSDRCAVEDGMIAGEYKLIYAAPERLASESFLQLLKRTRVAFFAIDEAHCISMWGHDFRPEYRALATLRENFPDAAVHAFTATATERVREDIASQLRLRQPDVLVGSFDRPNLVFSAAERVDQLRQIQPVLERHRNESGIIYCIRRRDAEELAAALNAHGFSALPYHAGLSDEERHSNQDAFIHDRVNIIVATVAFGMGIDKSNVRYVIHAGLPKSIEHYQQESGRAGRDGLEAECLLLYTRGDYGTWMHFTREMESAPREAAISQLNSIYDYAGGAICRRKRILEYFGQKYERESCEGCDICLGEREFLKDSLVAAQKILSCVFRLKERFGADYAADVLIGSKSQRILQNGHDKLSTYGIITDEKKEGVRDWIEQLVAQGALAREPEHQTLSVTQKGWKIIRGEVVPRLARRRADSARKSKASLGDWIGVDQPLFEKLRELRMSIANADGIPAYLVFDDRTLRQMARNWPCTPKDFRQTPGVGQRKWEMHGETFMNAIREHAGKHPRPQFASSKISRPVVSNKSTTKTLAFDLFSEGAGIQDVISKTGRASSTVHTYLSEYIESEAIADASPWVEEQVIGRIESVLAETGTDRLRPIYEALDEEIAFEQIRIVLACRANRDC